MSSSGSPVSIKGLCPLCRKKVFSNEVRVRNSKKQYSHKSCYDDAHQLCCENCGKKWLWPTKETNNQFHPNEWCMAVYVDGSTNESVYCPTCASNYGGVSAANSNSELYMVP